MRFVERVEDRAVLLDLRTSAPCTGSAGQRRDVDRVDARRRSRRTAREQRAGVGELVVAQDAAWDRLAVDAIHHEAVPEFAVGG